VRSAPLVLGVIDGYASEGGYDVPGGIATCYSPAVGLGRVTSPGLGDGLWDNYESAFRAARRAGFDGIAMTVEWSRVAPRYNVEDLAAWEHYEKMMNTAVWQGLSVSVNVVGSVWPAWLGQEAWLLPWVEEAFAEHLDRVVARYGERIASLRLFTRDVVDEGFRRGTMPPWRTRARDDARDAALAIERMVATAMALPYVGPLVRRVKDVPASLPADTWPTVLARRDDYDEIHVATLLPGAGPTARESSVLRLVEGEYVGELPDALRRRN
jgi:hypothetical protein